MTFSRRVAAGTVLAGVIGLFAAFWWYPSDAPDSASATPASRGERTSTSSTTPLPTTERPSPPVTVGQADGQDPLAAPVHPIAAQGPFAEAERYVLVTWDYSALDATAYEIERDGEIVGTVEIDDQPWDDMAWRDDSAAPGSREYRVRAVSGSDSGPWSATASLIVRSESDVGQTYLVDSYTGTDLQRAEAAVEAASTAGGGIVAFGARTYVFNNPLQVWGSNVVLQGAGRDQTILAIGFENGTESCGAVAPLIQFRGELEPVAGALLMAPVLAGQRTALISNASLLAVGDVIALDAVIGQRPTGFFEQEGIVQDPGAGIDQRNPWDANEVVSISGDEVTFASMFVREIPQEAEIWRYQNGRGNGIELLTVQGIGPDDLSYHRLVDVIDQVEWRLADVTARWANRTFIDASGYDIRLVGFTGIEGGANGYQLEACKYKLGFATAADVYVLDAQLGSMENDLIMSLLTVQLTNRMVVRNSTFGGSRTYGFNEHGGGSIGLVVENNFFSTGPNGWAGILLGNDTWGFGGDTAIRNNRFDGNVNDVLMLENPFNVSIVNNQSNGCLEACIVWSGWGGFWSGYTPIEDPTLWGSARLLLQGNVFTQAARGLDLGNEESSGYPYTGIRDVVILDNIVQSGGDALKIYGDEATTSRVVVNGNEFGGAVDWPSDAPEFVWAQNPSDPRPEIPGWASPYQDWERP